MRWTKLHSQNAVAAKAFLRIARATAAPAVKDRRYLPKPRRPAADFIITIKSKRGERVQVSIYRWRGSVRTREGQSARQFCRGLEQLLTKSA